MESFMVAKCDWRLMAVGIDKIRGLIAALGVALFVAALLGDWIGFGFTLFPGGTFLDGLGLFFLAYFVMGVYLAIRVVGRFRNPYT